MPVARSIAPPARTSPGGLGATWRTPKAYVAAMAYFEGEFAERCGGKKKDSQKNSRMRQANGFFALAAEMDCSAVWYGVCRTWALGSLGGASRSEK